MFILLDLFLSTIDNDLSFLKTNFQRRLHLKIDFDDGYVYDLEKDRKRMNEFLKMIMVDFI